MIIIRIEKIVGVFQKRLIFITLSMRVQFGNINHRLHYEFPICLTPTIIMPMTADLKGQLRMSFKKWMNKGSWNGSLNKRYFTPGRSCRVKRGRKPYSSRASDARQTHYLSDLLGIFRTTFICCKLQEKLCYGDNK